MSKPDTHRPGSANRTQSKNKSTNSSEKGDEKRNRLSEEKASLRQSKNRGKRYQQTNDSNNDRAEELDRNSGHNEGLWAPKTELIKLYSPDDLVRMKLTWICATLLGVLALAGVAGIVVLLIFRVDTAPLLQYVERVTNYAFVALAFALGYYFRGKHSKKRNRY